MENKETILIGKVIIPLRKARRMSQDELAFKADISRSFMYKIENNISEPGIGTFSRLAEALGMRGYELFKIIEESPDTEFGTKKSRNSKPNK